MNMDEFVAWFLTVAALFGPRVKEISTRDAILALLQEREVPTDWVGAAALIHALHHQGWTKHPVPLGCA